MNAPTKIRGTKGSRPWVKPTVATHGRPATEHEEQADFVRWFRRAYGNGPGLNATGVRIFAVPNGGGRSKAEGARLQSEGLAAGVPDLCVPAWGPLWIEFKAAKTLGARGGMIGGGHVSPEQENWHAYLRSLPGQTVLVCYGADDAKEQVGAFIAARALVDR